MRTPLPRRCGHLLPRSCGSSLPRPCGCYMPRTCGHPYLSDMRARPTSDVRTFPTSVMRMFSLPRTCGHALPRTCGCGDEFVECFWGARDWEDATKRRIGCSVFLFLLNRIHPKRHTVARECDGLWCLSLCNWFGSRGCVRRPGEQR